MKGLVLVMVCLFALQGFWQLAPLLHLLPASTKDQVLGWVMTEVQAILWAFLNSEAMVGQASNFLQWR